LEVKGCHWHWRLAGSPLQIRWRRQEWHLRGSRLI